MQFVANLIQAAILITLGVATVYGFFRAAGGA